jgi:hybrid cluster-associated redox disulfide protein
MKNIPINLNWIVADLLEGWPAAVPVFLKHRLGCAGCAMAPFDTLADVARVYQLDPQAFLAELEGAIGVNGGTRGEDR